jgi:hypothetical protein
MKRYSLILIVSSLTLALPVTEAFSQRGGRGAGGGSRPSINRSPSMSRPSAPAARPSIPSRPSAGQLPATRPSTPSRPSAGQLPATRPGAGTRPSIPSAGTRPSIDRDKIQNSIGVRPGQQPSMPDWFKPGASQLPATGNRPGAKPPVATPPIAGQPPAGKPPIGKPPVAKPPIAGKPPIGKPPVATPPIAGRPPGTRPPGVRPPARPPVARPPIAGHPPRPWYPGHPNYPVYRPGHWWRWATAGAVTGWVVHRWANPIYYTYGSGGTVYYENNVVYVNGQEYGSAKQYYENTSELVASVPEMTDEQAGQTEWLPLGVFALTAEGVNASSMYLQLAVTKDGVIAGTFYNETSGATHPVEGMVDEKTQRAVWKAADGTNKDLIMETGLYNLTKDQADLLVHFGPEQTQTALLVRLDESERPDSGEPAVK